MFRTSNKKISNKKISKVFPFISQRKTCDPQGGAIFDPRSIIWTLLVEAHEIRLHAKFDKPMPYG